jgi:hypothetical protein
MGCVKVDLYIYMVLYLCLDITQTQQTIFIADNFLQDKTYDTIIRLEWGVWPV